MCSKSIHTQYHDPSTSFRTNQTARCQMNWIYRICWDHGPSTDFYTNRMVRCQADWISHTCPELWSKYRFPHKLDGTLLGKFGYFVYAENHSPSTGLHTNQMVCRQANGYPIYAQDHGLSTGFYMNQMTYCQNWK